MGLKDGARLNQISYCRGIEHFPSKPGVYVFARKFGNRQAVIYHRAPYYLVERHQLKWHPPTVEE
jgi:hypothetical protein